MMLTPIEISENYNIILKILVTKYLLAQYYPAQYPQYPAQYPAQYY